MPPGGMVALRARQQSWPLSDTYDGRSGRLQSVARPQARQPVGTDFRVLDRSATVVGSLHHTCRYQVWPFRRDSCGPFGLPA